MVWSVYWYLLVDVNGYEIWICNLDNWFIYCRCILVCVGYEFGSFSFEKNDRKNGFKELDLQNGYGNWINRDVDWMWKMGPEFGLTWPNKEVLIIIKKRMSRLIWN